MGSLGLDVSLVLDGFSSDAEVMPTIEAPASMAKPTPPKPKGSRENGIHSLQSVILQGVRQLVKLTS